MKKKIIFLMALIAPSMVFSAAHQAQMARMTQVVAQGERIIAECKKFSRLKQEVSRVEGMINKLRDLEKTMGNIRDRALVITGIEQEFNKYETEIIPSVVAMPKLMRSGQFDVPRIAQKSRETYKKAQQVIAAFKQLPRYAITVKPLELELAKIYRFFNNFPHGATDQYYMHYLNFLNQFKRQIDQYLAVDVPKIKRELFEKERRRLANEQYQELIQRNQFKLYKRGGVRNLKLLRKSDRSFFR